MTEHEIETLINSKHLTGDYAEGFRAALKHVNKKAHEDFEYCNNVLTAREMEILALAYMPGKLIGNQLNISQHTVTSHFTNISNKMGFIDKKDMIRFATNAGIIKMD